MALAVIRRSFVCSTRGEARSTPACPPSHLRRHPGCPVTRHVACNQRTASETTVSLAAETASFVCTSSPAVEQAVRSFARDLELLRLNPSLFAPNVNFNDGLRAFQGNQRYKRLQWIQENVQKPQVTILKLQMLDQALDKAQVDWRLTGQCGLVPIDITIKSVIEMNMLTGRILNHSDAWDLSRLSGPASLLVSANRAAWAAKQASLDAQEKLSEAAETLSATLSIEDDESDVYRDPTDPTKFFQGNQRQQNWNDVITFAMIAVALYAVYQGFSSVIKL